MRRVASARAAISVVNALPLGVGAAVGVEWPARVTAELVDGPGPLGRTAIEPPSSRTTLVRALVRASRARFAPSVPGELRLRVRSTIPPARGLKSSTAVGTAVAWATARACGREPTPHEVAALTAETGRAIGTSATGAFDDALAGLLPGLVVTDNRTDTELKRFSFDPDLAVALWVPGRRHPRSSAVRARFRRERTLARRAVDAALAGEWERAMQANTALVERAMGYRYAPLHAAVRNAGAIASGVSGLGPTFAAVAPERRLTTIVRALPRTGMRRAARFASDEPPAERRRD